MYLKDAFQKALLLYILLSFNLNFERKLSFSFRILCVCDKFNWII